ERLTSDKYKAYLAAQDYSGKYSIHKTLGIKNIYVGNFSFNMTESELRSLFEPYGTVETVIVAVDRDTGRSRGFGFVSMPNDEAEKAIAALNGKESGGRALTVSEARPQTQRVFRRSDQQGDSPSPRPRREIN